MPAPVRVFFDQDISAYVVVNLREWGGRWYYFSGRYYDRANQLLIRKCLKAGDTYIDIGANLGIHTLAASRAVGKRGLVIAVEPNPEAFSQLTAHLIINQITNVRSFNVGLSDRSAELELKGSSDHSGTFTFREVQHSAHSVKVSVVPGDQLIDKSILRQRVLVKVDTEGFEHHVIRGLKELLSYTDIGLVIEVTDQWLRETGSSAKDLYAELRKCGFQSYGIRVGYSWFRPVLELHPVDVPPSDQHDALFVRPGFLQ